MKALIPSLKYAKLERLQRWYLHHFYHSLYIGLTYLTSPQSVCFLDPSDAPLAGSLCRFFFKRRGSFRQSSINLYFYCLNGSRSRLRSYFYGACFVVDKIFSVFGPSATSPPHINVIRVLARAQKASGECLFIGSRITAAVERCIRGIKCACTFCCSSRTKCGYLWPTP